MNTERVRAKVKIRDTVLGLIGAGGLIQQIFISAHPSLELIIACFLIFWSPGAMALVALRALGGTGTETTTPESSPSQSQPGSSSSPSSSSSST